MTLNQLHRHLTFLLASLWASVCLALTAPHDIGQAVAKGQLPQAEQMLREVIAEKPRSARAHYELAQVLAREGRPTEALQAIHTARELDPSLKFAQSPEKFNAVAHAIGQQAAAKSAPAATDAATKPATQAPVLAATPAAHAAPAAPAQPAWLWPALLTGGFALLVLWLWRRVQARPGLQPQPAGMGASMGSYAPEAPRGFGAQYDPRGAAATGCGNPYPTYPTPASGGSGVAGAVVGGLAGVAAGYALSKALESHDHPGQVSNAGNNMGASQPVSQPMGPMEDVGLVRMDPGADMGSFDAGSGDDWVDDSGSGDNW